MSRPEPILYKTNAGGMDTTSAWAAWVDDRITAAIDVNNEAVGQALGEYCGQQIAPLKREIELLRREVTQLREHVELERGLKELRTVVDAARRQVPNFPKIVERLEAGQSRLRREVADAKEKLGDLRVDASLTNHRLAELGTARAVDKSKLDELRQANEATTAKIDAIFPMHKIHPAAAASLRDYAADALKTETVYQFAPSMFERETQMEPAASGPEE